MLNYYCYCQECRSNDYLYQRFLNAAFFVMVMMCHISSFCCRKVTPAFLQPGCKLDGKALSFGKMQVL